LVIGGEALKEQQFDFLKENGYNVDIVNEYGPTEATVGCCTYTFNTNQTAQHYLRIPIGKPIDNTQILILNEGKSLAPIGVYGEMYIGGDQITNGYLNKETLTEEKFVSNPLTNLKTGLFYKSGDIGRWLPDGNIEFLGRKDEQVKIKGYRIELGEIENVLNQSEAISQSVVLVKEDSNGNKRLVAYIVPEKEYQNEELIDRLKQKLPEYMIPQLWVELERLPLTSHGKVDRKALPEIDIDRNIEVGYVAPRNHIEEQLVEIWQELLAIDRVGITDNFFDIGGDSLMAVRIIANIRRKLKTNVELIDLVNYPTIEQLVLRLVKKDDLE